MIERTEALVLRIHAFSNTSHVVSWLTPGHGKIATLVKGACRPKSAFLGQYDLFYTCDLLYYARERNGLHIARECCPLNPREALRHDWRAASCASYLCDVLWRSSVAGPHEADVYALASTVLDALGNGVTRPHVLHWFEMSLMRLLGFAPELWRCVVCAGVLPSGNAAFFSSANGGVLCGRCASVRKQDATRILPDTLAILRCWSRPCSIRSVLNTELTGHQLVALRNVLGVFLSHHLDLAPDSRRIAIEMMTSVRVHL